MAVKKPENMSFEEAVNELESIVQEMEHGELTLEQSLKQFERGVKLAQASNQKLQQAEQKVNILLANDEASAPSEFTDQVD
ncbi:exodeoxyribonuclease VII small subunit [Pseudoalteromonas luteoviolacea]|uniref:Exodeoxyribonuclease 7 small subunit n=2 Tax=Pseudoalteromonas luteoviolacea TaxID=43657 RepID=A0A162BI19_9GAMM|nr:exodeoxyribonuclease VII small subunit [Pseudoalteromonas luteoviolacea]AOT09579.1 exodeoxyribonuclease VII small subunit [Pseudoalteromonas luteoviolacea]AOT14491.1 exodeoxyribonuclease VII small subunit [Pseudoalteromonas luteoviolacea]AOT19406.1 exodeoxyribonuclease VII small subunit [Pseudoalteromonas luteoviolacea]KKE83562.1 exodeoxyribonuclease VII small subunit [Pseudoalteromonas luteoviolacea S4054]KZN62331.1 exodeoxyribonuclease VII small subunit [Pseudoalteromonas luteoviolacea CP